MVMRFFDKLKGLIGLRASVNSSVVGKRMRDVKVSALPTLMTAKVREISLPSPYHPHSRNYQGPKEIRLMRKRMGL